MFGMVRSLLRLLDQRKITKICLKTPERLDVMLIDVNSIKHVKIMLPSVNFNLCYTGPAYGKMVLYASPKIILYTLAAYFREGVGSITIAYLIGLIDATRPKIVIENSNLSLMLRIAQLRPDVSFITILNGYWLNGSRLIYGAELFHVQLHKISKEFGRRVQNYHIITFGKKDIEVFEDEGLGNIQTGIIFHSYGSELANFSERSYSTQCIPLSYDIVWISQCDSESMQGSLFIHKLFKDVTQKAFSFLIKFANDRQLSVHVHLRSDPSAEKLERKFYEDMAESFSKLTFSGNSQRPLSVYASAWRGSMICSIHSTLGFECIGWNKKVAFFLFDFVRYIKISSNRHAFDAELWPWLFDEFSPDIEHHLDDLLSLTDEEYSDRIHEYRIHLIGNDLNQNNCNSLSSLVNAIIRQKEGADTCRNEIKFN
jgi:surface carbohydrate biosynthesis protein